MSESNSLGDGLIVNALNGKPRDLGCHSYICNRGNLSWFKADKIFHIRQIPIFSAGRDPPGIKS